MLAITRLAGVAFIKYNHVTRFPSYHMTVSMVSSQNIFTFTDGETVSTVNDLTEVVVIDPT